MLILYVVLNMSDPASLPIIDSHIHLYGGEHIQTLNWTSGLSSEHPLNRPNSVPEYRAATAKQPNLKGFVFLETDRISGLQETDWQYALDEVDFLSTIARGQTHAGEGSLTDGQRLVLGIVPWAPVPAGPSVLVDYVGRVRSRFDSPGRATLVKGFRYLVQDKPPGTMLKPDFIAALQWLGQHHLTFDLGVDARSGGMHQLREACQMMEQVFEGGNKLKVIINHFCKPNLRLTPADAWGGHLDFLEWKAYIQKMASFDHTYMKLSGMFSELPPQEDHQPADIDLLVSHTKPWVDAVFAAFTPSRIMFGSDWPVVNMGGPGVHQSWQHWHDLVEAMLAAQNLTRDQKAHIWSGTAAEAYDISFD